MSTKLTISTIALLAIFISTATAAQIPVSWDGGGNGSSWSDADNWDPNIVPDNNLTDTYTVTLDAGTGEIYVNLQQNRTIDQLDCNGVVALSGFQWRRLTLVDVNGLTNYGEFEMFQEMDIQGNVTNTAGAEMWLEEISINGNLYNNAGGLLKYEMLNDLEQGDLQNDGTINIQHASDLLCEQLVTNNGTVNLYSGELDSDSADILDNNSTGVIKGFGVLHAITQIKNQGQIIASGGSLTVLSDGAVTNTGTLINKALSTLDIQPSADMNNLGNIEINAGGGVAFDCNLVNIADANVFLYGGTLAATTITQSADANFSGFGTISGDIQIDPNGLISLTGPTNIIGDVNIPGSATLEISDGQTLITGQTICDGTIHLKGGTIVLQGGCDCVDCTIINESGIDRNHFDFNYDGKVDIYDFDYFADSWLWEASWY